MVLVAAILVPVGGTAERTLYAARHTTGSILLPNGATVKEVQELLGHSTAKLTLDTYAHALPGSGRKVSDLMSGIIRRQTGKGRAKVGEVVSTDAAKKVS